MDVSFRFQAKDSDLVETITSILKLKNITYIEREEQDELNSDFSGYKPVTGYTLILNIGVFEQVLRHFQSIIRYYLKMADIRTIIKIQCSEECMEVKTIVDLEKAFSYLERKCKAKK